MIKIYKTINQRNDFVTDFVANGSFESLRKNVKYNYSEDYAILIRLVDYTNKFRGPFVYVNKESYDFLSKSSLCSGDIIISNVGENVGTVFQVPNIPKPMTLGPNAILVKMVDKNQDFWYYWFKSSEGQKKIRSIVNSSAQPKFNKTSFKELSVPCVELNIQYFISKNLKILDSKIEINNKINSELEQMAKTLYNYWFVQFDFPDKNGKPYKTSGGKMVYNEELKRKIPEGWEIRKLEDVFEFERGVEPGSTEYLDSSLNKNCIKFFRVGDIEGESCVFIDSTKNDYTVVKERDVIVTFDGSVGKLGFGLSGAISGGLRKVYDKLNKFDNSLVYFIFRDKRIIATIHKYATGSILLHASSSINHLVIPFEENIYLKFQEIVRPIFDKMVENRQENQKLAELRDWLLPMLMNGQIKVK